MPPGELCLRQSWTDDPDLCREVGIPEEKGFATKPQLAQEMISRALQAGVPFAWFTADEAYGQAKWLHAWLEEHGVSYVMAIRRSDTLTMAAGERRADALIAERGPRSWQKISAGAGAQGPREYHWARVPVRPGWAGGRGHWLLARRSLSDPEKISYYACSGPRRASTADLAWAAGSRWHIEECFQQAKNEAGLDHYRSAPGARGTHTSPCPCLPWPGSPRPAQARQKGNRQRRPGHDRLHASGNPAPPGQDHPAAAPDPGHAWSWSRWRRKRIYPGGNHFAPWATRERQAAMLAAIAG